MWQPRVRVVQVSSHRKGRCRSCGTPWAGWFDICPHCGTPIRNPLWLRLAIVTGFVILTALAIYLLLHAWGLY